MHLPRVLAWVKPLGRLGHSQNAGCTPLLPHPRPLLLAPPYNLGLYHTCNSFHAIFFCLFLVRLQSTMDMTSWIYLSVPVLPLEPHVTLFQWRFKNSKLLVHNP
jgi:hypothetical protein